MSHLRNLANLPAHVTATSSSGYAPSHVPIDEASIARDHNGTVDHLGLARSDIAVKIGLHVEVEVTPKAFDKTDDQNLIVRGYAEGMDIVDMASDDSFPPATLLLGSRVAHEALRTS